MHNYISDFISSISNYKFKNQHEVIPYIKNTLGKQYAVRWEIVDDILCRIVITTIQSGNYKVNSMLHRANGLVLEYPTFKILAIGQPNYLNFDKLTSKSIKKYEFKSHSMLCSFITDGTSINLYYYNDKWCLGSNKGYDVSNIKWISDLNFREAFEECINMSVEELCKDFDKKKCYVYMFHHKTFHPLTTKNNNAWFVQCVDIQHERLTISYVNPRQDFKSIETRPVMINTNFIHNVNQINAHSLENFVKTSDAIFGHVIHYADNARPSIVIESKLYSFAKKCFYSSPKDNGIHTDRLRTLLVNAYFTCGKILFKMNMYEPYKDLLHKIEDKVENISEEVLTALRTNSTTEKNLSEIHTIIYDIAKSSNLDVFGVDSIKTIIDIAKMDSLIPLYIKIID